MTDRCSTPRTSGLAALACAVICVRVAAVGAAVPGIDVPYLSGIAIDGDSADWRDRGLWIDILTPNRPERAALGDFDGRVGLGWDERGVLVLARVVDDVIIEAEQEGSLWNGDGMELFLASSIGAPDLV